MKLWYSFGLLLLPDVATRVPGTAIDSFSQLLRQNESLSYSCIQSSYINAVTYHYLLYHRRTFFGDDLGGGKGVHTSRLKVLFVS